MQLDVVNKENLKVGSVELNDEVFGGRINGDLIVGGPIAVRILRPIAGPARRGPDCGSARDLSRVLHLGSDIQGRFVL